MQALHLINYSLEQATTVWNLCLYVSTRIWKTNNTLWIPTLCAWIREHHWK